jgi:hypothetical protein
LAVKPLSAINPYAVEVSVISREIGIQRTLRGHLSQATVHVCQAARNVAPDLEVADCVEFDAAHLLQQQPIATLFGIRDAPVTNGCSRTGGLKYLAVDGDLAIRMVVEMGSRLAGACQQSFRAQVLEQQGKSSAIFKFSGPLLDCEAGVIVV